MDVRVWKVLTIVLSAISFVLLVFLVLFGVRLVNFNKIKASEISTNLQNQEKQLLKDFQVEKEAEKAKFTADPLFGNFTFEYPKAWFTNVTQADKGDVQLTLFADPKIVVVKTNVPTVAALRVQVIASEFNAKIKEIDNKNKAAKKVVSKKEITLSSLKGFKYTEKGLTYVLLPLRDKTLYIGTDDSKNFATQYQAVLDSFAISR